MASPSHSELSGISGYTRFWWAESVSQFGTYFTTVAIQVLIVANMHGSAADVGLVSGARWLPYMLFGLIAGAVVDRMRRRPVLVVTDLTRGLLLIAIPVLTFSGRLSIAAIAVFMVIFGTIALIGDAAAQAFIPRLVPAELLTRAHARIDQSVSVAQTAGPALAGALVTALGAPIAVIIDAVSYIFSGLTILRLSVDEPVPQRARQTRMIHEIVEGLRWVYRHPTLAPLALTTHVWFVFSGISGAVLVPFILRTLALNPFAVGLALSCAGIGGLVGSLVAPSLGQKWDVGPTAIFCHAVTSLAFIFIALAPAHWAGLIAVGIGQFLFGFSIGAENSNTLGYRQAVTPDHLQGRMNATMRSINRAMLVVAAPLGGFLADRIGFRQAYWVAVAGFAFVAAALALSRFRSARIGDIPVFEVT